jgi:cytochrome b561
MPRAQQRFAKASEYCLYAPLLLQPLTGLAQLARGRSFMLFEWRVPKVMAGNEALTLLFHQIHTVSAWLLLGLIGLHVLAALFHRLVLKDEVLQSMLPWRSTNAAAVAPSSTFAPEHAARPHTPGSQAAIVATVTP